LAALYALQACEGLAEAHAHGLIHRDLKPEHLFIVEVAGTSPFVKLLDFGISKHITGSIRGAVTNPGDSIGSPCYMSPEQMQDPSTVDVRTDVWSLGTVLYEALAATKAFDADSLMQLQWQIMGESPTSLAELCPSVPAPLEAIVMRCLEKDREQRFLTIAEVGDALRAFLTQYGRERTDTDVYVDALPGAEAVASGAHPSGFVAGEVLPSRSAAPTVRQRAPVADADARAPAKDISGADDEPSAAGVPRRSRHPVVRALILVGVSLGVVTILGLWALGGTDGISALTLGLSVDADRPQDTSVMKQQRSSVPSMHTLEQKPPTGEVLRPATEATTPTPNPSQPAASQAVVSQPRTKPTEASAERRGASPTSIEEALTPAEKDARYRSWLRSQRMTPVEEVAMPDEGSTD
jgi:serine/threonine-protein kinase